MTVTVSLNEVIAHAPQWFLSKLWLHLESAPGRGKTTTMLRMPDIFRKHFGGGDFGIVVVNATTMTPMDTIGFGIPRDYVIEGKTGTKMIFSDPFTWFTSEGKRLNEYKDGGIVFVDEFDKAVIDVKQCLAEGGNSGRFGPHKLPHNWILWSAGNRPEDNSGSTKNLDFVIDRQTIFGLRDDIDSVVEYLRDEAKAFPEIYTFAEKHPLSVFEAPKDNQAKRMTPRGLGKVDNYLKTVGMDRVNDDIVMKTIAATVGGVAQEVLYTHFQIAQKLPSIADICKDPKGTPIPEEIDGKLILSHQLSYATTKENAEPISTYVERMGKEWGVTCAVTACKRDHTLVSTPVFQKWAKQNSGLMAVLIK